MIEIYKKLKSKIEEKRNFQNLPQEGLIIVAHPDDETIWMGGTILKHKNWNWTLVSLSHKNNRSRRSRFKMAAVYYGASFIISDLDDSPNVPLSAEYVMAKIKNILPKRKYDFIYTHGSNGEYGHIRHKEVHQAVKKLIEEDYLQCKKVFYFSYIPISKMSEPQIAIPDEKSDLCDYLEEDIFKKKLMIVRKIYGLKDRGLEVISCNQKETFKTVELDKSSYYKAELSKVLKNKIKKTSRIKVFLGYFYCCFYDILVGKIEEKRNSKSPFWKLSAWAKDFFRDIVHYFLPKFIYCLNKPFSDWRRKRYWKEFNKRRKLKAKSNLKVTLALTNFNRYDTIVKILDYANNDERITEVVISDDNSNKQIKEKLRKLESNKVKIFFNKENFGPFKNKTLAIEKSTNNWVFLFDSDDLIDESYLDNLEKEQPLNPEIVYCPAHGYTTRFGKLSSDEDWDYSEWEDKVIDLNLARDALKNNWLNFDAFLNISAYVINKEKYLECALPYKDVVFYNDSIHFKYLWLKRGLRCKVVSGMSYYHSYDDRQSFYKSFQSKHEICREAIVSSIKNNTPYDFNIGRKKL